MLMMVDGTYYYYVKKKKQYGNDGIINGQNDNTVEINNKNCYGNILFIIKLQLLILFNFP